MGELKQIWSSNFMILCRRIAIVYALMALCRVTFYIYNQAIIGSIDGSELWSLFRGAMMFDTVSIAYSYGLFVLVSLLPMPVGVRRARWYQLTLFSYFIVVVAVVVGLNLVDVVYFNYTGVRLTAADIIFADNDNTVGLVGKFLLENWYLLLLWVGIIALGAWLYRYTGRVVNLIKNRWAYYGVNTIVMVLALLLTVVMMRGGSIYRTTRPIHLNNSMRYTVSQAKANMILSNPFCILRTISNKGIRYTKYLSEAELATIYTPYHYPKKGEDIASPFEGRNVIIFVMESFSAEHSALLNPHLYPDGVGVTPFMDSLMRDGYYSMRSYANGKKSIDALPSILGSMPSYEKPFVTIPQSLGKGMQLPKILADEGYNTLFFCGSPAGSMGLDAYASQAGVRSMYDKNTYDERYPGNDDFDNFWGIWDEPFMDYMGEVFGQTEQPFMSTLFTVTSHHPFEVPKEYADVLAQGLTKNHKPVAYTDMSVRKFFERYGGEEWFQNSIFVFCADHVSSERFAPESETPVGRERIMSFIYTPDGSLRGVGETLFQQIDIMPTVLGLLGYDKPYFAFGRDVFSEPTPVAISYNQYYQMITDSLVMHFDGERVLAVYEISDVMMRHNIASAESVEQRQMQRYLEAVIQQYYSHLERREYIVPEEGE